MNVTYRNKKVYYDLVIKLYESDKESTERDIKITDLIETMVEEVMTSINLTLVLLRS